MLSGIDSSQFDTAKNLDKVERAVSLPLEPVDETVEVDAEVDPKSMADGGTWEFDEEGFFLHLMDSGGEDNSPFGLG